MPKTSSQHGPTFSGVQTPDVDYFSKITLMSYRDLSNPAVLWSNPYYACRQIRFRLSARALGTGLDVLIKSTHIRGPLFL